ncbi:hypothetical protein PIB30_090705 [Stylosanthes scabra]|uniref:RNase H type-1 domain-containing protein n=1 Tax=Stylosanthes scabra TaxID=79078 RepID=A0ABU6QTQ7_9FABA|nr:hypothetical protein [Stylosanthes scabra]
MEVRDESERLRETRKMTREWAIYLEAIVATGLWWQWRFRNPRIFGGEETWSSFKVKCDASIFFESNCAGFDAVIRNDMGMWIKGCSGPLPMWSIRRCNTHLLPSDEDADVLSKIRELWSRDWSINWNLVPREANKVADTLAKHGAKYNNTYIEWLEPKSALFLLISSEAASGQATSS